MKIFRHISISNGSDSTSKTLLRAFEVAWNRTHSIKFDLKDWLQADFLSLPAESPLVQELIDTFAGYNETNGNRLRIEIHNRVKWDREDQLRSEYFRFIAMSETELVKDPGDPRWMYKDQCRKHGSGDSLPVPSYVRKLQDFGLEHPKKDFSQSPQGMLVFSPLALAEIRKNAEARIGEYPVPTQPGRTHRDKSGRTLRSSTSRSGPKKTSGRTCTLIDLLDVAGPLASGSEVTEAERCLTCKRVWNVVHRNVLQFKASSIPKSDLFRSRELFGVQLGGHWMSPLIIISRKLHNALKSAKVTGWRAEPVLVLP
jgi:hypothetical protein